MNRGHAEKQTNKFVRSDIVVYAGGTMSANRNKVDRPCVSGIDCGNLLRSHTYAYDGWNLILERIAYTGGATDEIEYFWGSDLSGSEQGGVGGLVALSINGAFYFPCYDNNGNIIAYVDESGSLTAQFAYDAFGNPLATSNSELATLFSFRFSTKYLDPETGFYYYGYRYYAPDLGRWLTRDPIEEQGGLNLYGFCGNDAVNRWDKLGMKTVSLKGLRTENAGNVDVEIEGKSLCDALVPGKIIINLTFDVPLRYEDQLSQVIVNKYGKIEVDGKSISVSNEGRVQGGTKLRFVASAVIKQEKCSTSVKRESSIYIWWTKTSEKFPLAEAQEIKIKWSYSCLRKTVEVLSTLAHKSCCQVDVPLKTEVVPVYYDE